MRFPLSLVLSVAGLLVTTSAQAQIDTDGDGVADTLDAFPTDPAAVAAAYYPAQGAMAMMLLEDLWPNTGDLDMNDMVLKYSYVFRLDANNDVASVQATFSIRALGGIFPLGLGWHLPVAGAAATTITRSIGGAPSTSVSASAADTELVIDISKHLKRDLFGSAVDQINSIASDPYVQPQDIDVQVTFGVAQTINLALAPFDIFAFYVSDRTHEIHGPKYSGTAQMNVSLFGTGDDSSAPGRSFVDVDGIPFVLHFASEHPYPSEANPISSLYPDILAFAASGGVTNLDFYQTNVNTPSAYPINSSSNPGASCKSIRDLGQSQGDGLYWIDLTGGSPSDSTQLYCDMTFDGGGWTLVMVHGDASSQAVHESDGPQGAIDATGRGINVTGSSVADMYKAMTSAQIHSLKTETFRITNAGTAPTWKHAFWDAPSSYHLFQAQGPSGSCRARLGDAPSTTSNNTHRGLQFFMGSSGGWQCGFGYQFSDGRWHSYARYRNQYPGYRWWVR